MTSLPEQTSLAGQLLEAVTRDISTYVGNPDDPNRETAGKSALRSLNALIRVLNDTRRYLLVELNKGYDLPDSATLPNWAAGNSGPGGRYERGEKS